MSADRFRFLPTEAANPKSRFIDRLPSVGILRLMNSEDRRVVNALDHAAPALARVVDRLVAAWRQNHGLLLVGAGTSGRLAVLEAAECPPTFSATAQQVRALMAGGKQAVFRSQEGAEDSRANAAKAVRAVVHRGDVVVGIAASGITPFVEEALRVAQHAGAYTVLLTCNTALKRVRVAKAVIRLATGPEVVSGSTRLKAGTACKMALNMLTTAAFVRFGKTYGNRMVDVQPRSAKLRARAERLVVDLGGVSIDKAKSLLRQTAGEVKTAVVMARRGVSMMEARQRLQKAHGVLRKVIG